MADDSIIYKKLEPFQIAFIKTRIDTRDEIPPLLDRLTIFAGMPSAVIRW